MVGVAPEVVELSRSTGHGAGETVNGWLDALVVGLVTALAAEMMKSVGERWFDRRDTNRVNRCPRCGSGSLVRDMTRGEYASFSFLVLTFSLAFTGALVATLADVLLVVFNLASHGSFTSEFAVSTVAVLCWLVVRSVLPRLLTLRGRPPRACRTCGFVLHWFLPVCILRRNRGTPGVMCAEHIDKASATPKPLTQGKRANETPQRRRNGRSARGARLPGFGRAPMPSGAHRTVSSVPSSHR